MSQDALEVVPVPRDVHDDFLMSYLLLRAVVSLCEWDTGNPPPANLGMLAWNDLLAWAQLKFSEGTQEVLIEYATIAASQPAVLQLCRIHPGKIRRLASLRSAWHSTCSTLEQAHCGTPPGK